MNESETEEAPLMTQDDRVAQAVQLMQAFAERTGLVAGEAPRRYLWTDAYALCNWLGLARRTDERAHRRRARRLVDQVHEVLAHHRPDEPRTGWLSSPYGDASAEHPTRAGLRIGKPSPERGEHEPPKPHLEWDRDGHYFHYLTKWMQSLDQLARATREEHYHRWARELMDTAHRAFVRDDERPSMVWKMSIDLSRPAVASMGQHDPLDGLVTVVQLQATAEALGVEAKPPLDEAREDFRAMIEARALPTADPLGLGGLLTAAYRLAQADGGQDERALVTDLLRAASVGLSAYVESDELRAPASRRLAFRELGLAIGLHAVEELRSDVALGVLSLHAPTQEALERLEPYLSVATRIEQFWLEPAHQRVQTWVEHRDINEVMLATSLVPCGCVRLASVGDAREG